MRVRALEPGGPGLVHELLRIRGVLDDAVGEDEVLDDREPEAGAARRPRAIAAIEALDVRREAVARTAGGVARGYGALCGRGLRDQRSGTGPEWR